MHLPRLAQRPHLSNPTAGRRAAAAATACALAVTVSLAAAAVKASSSDAAQATGAIPAELASSAAQGSAPAQEVRLITGDVIRLNSAGGVAGVEPGPRADATRPRFLTYTRSDQTYVFPSDVQSLIGRQLDPELFNVTELASYGLGRDGAVPVIVQAGSGAGAATVAELAKLGLKVTAELGVVPAQAGQADAATDSGPAASWLLIEAAAEPQAGVEKIWLDGMTHVEPLEGADGGPDPGYQTPPWMEFIGADQAKAGGLSGAGVKVAVVDSGVDSNHPDLAGQVVAAKDFTDLGSPIDENGHGTFVASEIAGTGAASDGVYAGVAPGAKIVNARVLDADGWGSNSGILEGIIWAAEQGAQVINLSLGDPGMYGDGTSYFDQVVNQVAEDYGCLIVVAAGNDADFQTVSTPAVADRALSVGATAQDGYHAWFSSAGPRRGDGAVNPQIVAPGAGAEEVFTDEWGSYTELGGMTGAEAGSDGYVSDYMGTSMAAPLVAGAAALLIESDTTWDADKLRAKLVASAVPAPDEASVFEQGAGVLNIPKALTQSLTTSPTELNLGLVPFPATGSVTKTLTYANAGATAQTLTLEAGLTTVEYLGPVVNTTDPPGPDDSEPANGDGSEGEDGPIAPLSPDHVSLSAQTVTVPAGGVASVDVTVDAEAFQAGYIGGYLTASDAAGDAVLRTPIGLANEPEKHELTVTATGLDGQPLENADLAFDLTVVDLNSFMSVTLQPVDGKASVELVAGGDYLLSAYAATANDTGGSEDLAGLTPLIGFDGPTEVTIDGASAKDFTVPTGQPVDGVTLASTTITIEGDEWSSGFEFGVLSYVDPLSTSGVHIIPPAPADGAEVTMAGWASLAQPKAEAALDACGLDPVPVVDASGQVPTGHSAYGLVDALDGADLPAGAADQAAVVGLSASELADITVDIILAVHERLADIQAAGYGAAVVGTDLPTIGRMVVEAAVNWLEDEPITLPVLVTNQAGTEKLAAAAAQGGSIHTLGRGTPEYLYQLYQTFDPQADAYTLATDDSSTAKVTVHHRAMGSTGYNQDTFWSDYGGVVMAVNAEPASSYVAHLSPETLWTLESYLVDRETGMGLNYFAVPSRLYYADVDVDLTLGSQVHGAGFDTENGATLMRFDDTLFGALPLFVDGQGHGELARNLDNELGYASLDAVLTDLTTGQEVLTTGGEETVYEIWVEGLDPAAHKYRLDATTKSDSDLWSLSTDVTSSWEWVSAAPPPAGGEDPEDADQTGWQTEALLQVWYDLPGLDAYNAGAPNQPIVLHIGDLTDTEPFALDAVTLEASTDGGATWTPVALSDSAPPADSVGATGNEKLRVGLIEADAGEVVSLRSHVAGGTSSFDQTILDAYPVTTSPRDYQTPASWTSCGIESPLPINLTSTVSSAFQAKGQAPDATVTLSLIAPATPEPASPVPMVAGAGAEWRPDAFGDPAVVKLEGVFYGRSASAFAVADAAPADAVAIGTASAEVTLPTSGLEPVSVKVPAGFTVPTSQYGVWVWRIDPASQTAPVAPLIQPGLADAFGLTQSTQVTQMELSVNSKASKTAAKAAKSEGAQVCDSVWLEHGSAGDLWLNDWNSDKPVQVAVTGALYAAKTAGQAGPDAAAGLKPVKQFKLTFAGAGPDNAQTVCHSLAKGLAGAYGFQFGIDLAGQADGAANYLSKGFATNLWDAAATVQVTAADSGALEVTGAADLAPMLALALVLFAAGLVLVGRARWRARTLA